MEEIRLMALLQTYHVPFQTWGNGKTRMIDDLMGELTAERSVLVKNGTSLLRIVRVATVSVFCTLNSPTLQLKMEKKPDSQNGREYPWSTDTVSICEKLMPNEDALTAAGRSLEELGIMGKFPFTEGLKTVKGPMDSTLFPGLRDRYEIFPLSVFLSRSFYRPEGYREQGGGAICFVWVEV